MYTAQLIGDTKNIELRRRMINVEFTDGTTTFNKEFQFSIDTTVVDMKKVVKQYLDELNFVPPTIKGDISDYVPLPETPPTPAELARTAWNTDLAKLKQVKELIDLGVLDGTEAPVVTLRNKVKTGFKPAYIA